MQKISILFLVSSCFSHTLFCAEASQQETKKIFQRRRSGSLPTGKSPEGTSRLPSPGLSAISSRDHSPTDNTTLQKIPSSNHEAATAATLATIAQTVQGRSRALSAPVHPAPQPVDPIDPYTRIRLKPTEESKLFRHDSGSSQGSRPRSDSKGGSTGSLNKDFPSRSRATSNSTNTTGSTVSLHSLLIPIGTGPGDGSQKSFSLQSEDATQPTNKK